MAVNRKAFEPVVEIGQNIRLVPEDKFYEVKFIGGIPWIEKDFGSVSAGSTSGLTEVSTIYVRDGYLAQYRFFPKTDGLRIEQFKQPRAATRWALKVASAKLPDIATYADPHVEDLQTTEFFQFQDKSVFMDVKNTTGSDMSETLVWFEGFLYKLKKLEKKPERFTVIPTVAPGAL